MIINTKTGSMYTEDIKKVIYDSLEALEIAQPYLEATGWTRHQDAEIAQVESAIANARKALGGWHE